MSDLSNELSHILLSGGEAPFASLPQGLAREKPFNRSQRIGYVHVSNPDSKPGRLLKDPTLDYVFVGITSREVDGRSALDAVRRLARSGDTLVVESIDQLADNLYDLRCVLGELASRGVKVEFVRELLALANEALDEAESFLKAERRRGEVAPVQKRRGYRARKRTLTPEQVVSIKERIKRGEKRFALARELGISRQAMNQCLRGE